LRPSSGRRRLIKPLFGKRRHPSLQGQERQHQMVYEALKGRIGGELHALALTTSES
jgi:hypothetical protein